MLMPKEISAKGNTKVKKKVMKNADPLKKS